MQPSSNNCYDTGLREECGVFGIYDLDGADVSPSIYYGLSALQHRGQESCGIAVSDTSGPKGHVKSYKGLGLVNEVFKESKLEELSGNIGIGHVRYSTTGSTTVENAQPLVLNYLKGSLVLAHNGNLANSFSINCIWHGCTAKRIVRQFNFYMRNHRAINFLSFLWMNY